MGWDVLVPGLPGSVLMVSHVSTSLGYASRVASVEEAQSRGLSGGQQAGLYSRVTWGRRAQSRVFPGGYQLGLY